MTLIPWWAGKPAVWDVTVVCTSAGSYLNSSAREAGAAAEFAAVWQQVAFSFRLLSRLKGH